MIRAMVAFLGMEDREAVARANKLADLKELCIAKKVGYPPHELMFRAFKKENILEIWGRSAKANRMILLKTYPVVRASGGLGPKRREGDLQVPEGLYYINRFNPRSRFHLSLGLNYPNASDHILGDPFKPGGDIFIHGSNKSIGCLAMGDDQIEEIYTLARSTTRRIQVLMLPSREMPEETDLDRQLNVINSFFNKHRRLPTIKVDTAGNYVFQEAKRGK
jgi:murein L,D-transpeptidase YafK